MSGPLCYRYVIPKPFDNHCRKRSPPPPTTTQLRVTVFSYQLPSATPSIACRCVGYDELDCSYYAAVLFCYFRERTRLLDCFTAGDDDDVNWDYEPWLPYYNKQQD